mgnify:CR=1 FL=1
METVNRVPGHLFSHSDEEIRANALLAEQKVNLRHALSRLGSLERIKVNLFYIILKGLKSSI